MKLEVIVERARRDILSISVIWKYGKYSKIARVVVIRLILSISCLSEGEN
jgi:hypothetical protein